MIETLSHPAQSAEFLSKLHDGELSPAEAAAFESHRRECPECRASVAEFEDALAAYRSAPVPPHASDLSARILRKIRAASPSRRPFGVMFGIDVRWAGALAAALLVVIIGAPVFRRAPQYKRAVPPATSLPAPIPAYVLDAEEERPKQKQNETNRAPRKEAAPKAEAAPPKSAADDATASGRDLYQFAEPREGARESTERRDEIAATNAHKGDAAATLEADAAQEPAAPTLQAAAPPAETKDLAKSTTARRQSAAAPVGGEAGAGASADGPAPVAVVKLTIHPADAQGEAPEFVQTPSDERLAALRGRKYLLVVEAGGRVVAVEDRPAGRKPAKDKASEADEQKAARARALAESVLRELVFQPGDRARRLVIDIQ